MPAVAYHHTQQLRIKHLKVGEFFKLLHEVRTSPWTKRDGTPGETTQVFSNEVVYKLISRRRIQEVDRYSLKPVGKVMGLGAGHSQLAVTDQISNGWPTSKGHNVSPDGFEY